MAAYQYSTVKQNSPRNDQSVPLVRRLDAGDDKPDEPDDGPDEEGSPGNHTHVEGEDDSNHTHIGNSTDHGNHTNGGGYNTSSGSVDAFLANGQYSAAVLAYSSSMIGAVLALLTVGASFFSLS